MTSPPSPPAESEPHPRGTAGAWAAVLLMTLGVTVVTLGIIAGSWPLTIVGLVLGAGGIVAGKLSHIMGQAY